MLSALTSGIFATETDDVGSIFIDRESTFFPLVLGYLRNGRFMWPHDKTGREELHLELQYYGLDDRELPHETLILVNVTPTIFPAASHILLSPDLRSVVCFRHLCDAVFSVFTPPSLLSCKNGQVKRAVLFCHTCSRKHPADVG